MADETTDVSSKLQTVLVFRYIKGSTAVERFWGFFTSAQQTADSLSSLILNELQPLVGQNPNKMIAQSYDGAAVMSGRHGGVQAKIKAKYPLAHFVHCYAHKLNLIMTQAASQNSDVRIFFGNLSEIPIFFSNSSQRVHFLNKVVGRRIPRSVPTRWNFKSRTVNVVFEYREDLIECMEEIEETSGINTTTKNQAGAIRRLLQERSFVFWLTLFHYIMPHVDILYNELQKRIIDSVEISRCLKLFKENITTIRNQKMHEIMEKAKSFENIIDTKRLKFNDETWKISATEVCDVIINVAEDRFQYTDQLNAANLLICEKFEWYDLTFPQDYFTETMKSYPFLEKQRLKTELTVLYSSEEYRNFSSCAVLLNFLVSNNLQEVFREVIKLLKILVTMPMTTVEAERDFSTLNRIKTFLRSTMCQERLNALACLTIEQRLIRSISDFNERVIDKFAKQKDRRIELIFKKTRNNYICASYY
ncbi:zinc finger MYM-type protein 1-like [Sitophilus oryzae]|uniref:Zinc finger MYM-type protein 1-like n=1 Tax=Sitophilus oryzae TaxID=7048 RepID=A0A6J2YI30_SITOR|nr:zinc finger MYM-type protein 1-like [Sitophilus oryzae]